MTPPSSMTPSSGVRVLIATTAGAPVEIERLFTLPPGFERMSLACIGGGINKAPISDSYQRFVAAGSGIIEERFGNGSWRLDLSSPIDAGESWQLGAFLAHELKNAGRLAEKGEPAATIVVATGEVHHDLSVARIEGLAAKLGCLIEFLTDKPPEGRMIVAWPKSNHLDADDATRRKLDELGAKVIELDNVWPLLKELGFSVAEARSPDQLDELEAKIRERLKQVYGEWTVVLAAVADFLHVTVKVARLLVLGLVVGVGATGLLVVKTKLVLVPVAVAAYLACNYTSLENVCEYLVGGDGDTKCKTGEIYSSSLKKCLALTPSDGGTKFGQALSVCPGGEIYDYISKKCLAPIPTGGVAKFDPTALSCPIGEIHDFISNKCVPMAGRLPGIIEPKPMPAADDKAAELWCRKAGVESLTKTITGIMGTGPTAPGLCRPLSLAQVAGVKLPGPLTAPARKLSAQEIYRKILPSVLFVVAREASGRGEQGSAVAISGDVAMTNCHVVMYREAPNAPAKDMTDIRIQPARGSPIQAVLIDRHPDIDVCLIKALIPSFQPVEAIRYFGDVEVGEPVYTLGNPQGLGFTFAEGNVSALRSDFLLKTEFSNVRGDLIQTTAPISQGSSGGGLFDADGNLIGITQSSHTSGENLNFAIAADLLWVRYGQLMAPPPNPLR
jgi:S1-C subfamily serine protease